MSDLTRAEFREKLESSALMYFLITINKSIIVGSTEQVWIGRYNHLLKSILADEHLPVGISLKEIIDHVLANNSSKLKNYLEYLPGMSLKIDSNNIDPLAVQNHSWMALMFNCGHEDYANSITSEHDYKLVFKDLNCFTFSNKDNHIHIQSNSLNILDFDWTIISVESNNDVFIKDIHFKSEKNISYYIKNYEELSLLEGSTANNMIEILLF